MGLSPMGDVLGVGASNNDDAYRRGALRQRTSTSREEATLAGRIKMAMASAGIETPAELAGKLKMHRQTVHKWTSGAVTELTPELLFRLSDVLNVNARWLAFGPPESPTKPFRTDPETAELVQIRDALAENPAAKDQWLSQGRALVKIVSSRSVANPFPAKVK